MCGDDDGLPAHPARLPHRPRARRSRADDRRDRGLRAGRVGLVGRGIRVDASIHRRRVEHVRRLAGGIVRSAVGARRLGLGRDLERANLGFVSAYVLVRGGEAAIVDTGVAGSEDAIGRGAQTDRPRLARRRSRHPDPHAPRPRGQCRGGARQGAGRQGLCRSRDLPAIVVPRPLIAVADGDKVFDLRIVATPGHTAGHVAVFDEVGGLMVAGTPSGPRAARWRDRIRNSPADPVAAKASVAKLGALTFATLLVGHGEPILTGASAQVAALAAAG